MAYSYDELQGKAMNKRDHPATQTAQYQNLPIIEPGPSITPTPTKEQPTTYGNITPITPDYRPRPSTLRKDR